MEITVVVPDSISGKNVGTWLGIDALPTKKVRCLTSSLVERAVAATTLSDINNFISIVGVSPSKIIELSETDNKTDSLT
jgi:hypothetical protein